MANSIADVAPQSVTKAATFVRNEFESIGRCFIELKRFGAECSRSDKQSLIRPDICEVWIPQIHKHRIFIDQPNDDGLFRGICSCFVILESIHKVAVLVD